MSKGNSQAFQSILPLPKVSGKLQAFPVLWGKNWAISGERLFSLFKVTGFIWNSFKWACKIKLYKFVFLQQLSTMRLSCCQINHHLKRTRDERCQGRRRLIENKESAGFFLLPSSECLISFNFHREKDWRKQRKGRDKKLVERNAYVHVKCFTLTNGGKKEVFFSQKQTPNSNEVNHGDGSIREEGFIPHGRTKMFFIQLPGTHKPTPPKCQTVRWRSENYFPTRENLLSCVIAQPWSATRPTTPTKILTSFHTSELLDLTTAAIIFF